MRTYLKIINQPDGKIDISANDGIFSYTAIRKTKIDFIDYCEQIKDAWLNSDLKNFDGWDKSDREKIAYKWELAKQLPEGYYKYFFSLDDIQTMFQKEVANLANNLGIENYVLELHNDKYEDNKKR